MSASLREALYIIPCSNILAGRSHPSRPPLTHIIPCSNILASLRSLRNCAWNDMCEWWAGGHSLETKLSYWLAGATKEQSLCRTG